MPTCRECGSAVADQDRFCSSCGATTSDEPSGLLGVEEAVSQSSAVSTGGATRFLVPALAGLVLIVGLFWVLARSSTDPDDTDEAAAAEQSSSTRQPTTTEPTATSEESLSFESPIGVESGPLLGREVGLSLFIGGNSGSLRRIDLDTARILEFDVTRRRPVFSTGKWLIMVSDNSEDLEAVPLTDPEATPTRLGRTNHWPSSVFAGPQPDSVWIVGGDYRDFRWELVGLVDGEVIEQRPVGHNWFLNAGPDLATTPAGGIYEFVEGEYRFRFDGQISAASDSEVLAIACTGPTDCQHHWLDRESWEEIDRPPPDGAMAFGGSLSPDGRVYTTHVDRGLVIFDVERGERLEITVQGPDEIAVSPDGRYLARNLAGKVVIHDLDTLESYKLDIFAGSGLLFVETPADPSADEPEANLVSGTGE